MNPAHRRLAANALLLAALPIAALTAYHWQALHWYGPYKDMWMFVPLLDRPWGLSLLAGMVHRFNDAHFVFLTNALFLLDYHWAAGRNWLFVATVLVCQAGLAGIFCRLPGREALPHERRYLLGLSLLFLFGAGQLFNFLYSFDVQWHLAALFAAAAFYRLATAALLTWRDGLLLAVLCGLGGLSNAAGLLILPVLPLLLWVRGLRWPWVVAALVVIHVALGLLVPGRDSPIDPEVIRQQLAGLPLWQQALLVGKGLLAMQWYRLGWLAQFLCAPFSREWPQASLVWLLACVAWLASGWWQLRSRWQDGRQAQLFTLALASWCLLVGYAAMLARHWWPSVAQEERYQTVVLLFWLSALAHGYFRYRHQAWAAPLVALLALAWVLPSQSQAWSSARHLGWSVKAAHQAAVVGALDRESASPTLPIDLLVDGENNLEKYDPRFRAGQVIYFLQPEARVAWPATPPARQCPGQLQDKTPVEGGRHIWLSGEGRGLAQAMGVIDSKGQLRGRGVAQWQPWPDGTSPWKVVYDPAGMQQDAWPLWVLARDRSGQACTVAALGLQDEAALPATPYVWGPAYWHMQRAAFLRGELSW